MICPQCGRDEDVFVLDLCLACANENVADRLRIGHLIDDGHTEHCAKRQVHGGDGECECHLKGHVPGSVSRAILGMEDFDGVATVDR